MILEPEVSKLDQSNAIRVNGFSVPALITRNTHTTVELRDGAALAIGGLYQRDYQNDLRQLPALGNIPVLGALFRSARWRKAETELLIIVTPRVHTQADFNSAKDRVISGVEPNTFDFLFNGKALDSFFPRDTLRRVIRQPLEAVGYEARMDVVARMHGGGVAAQAGALRHGISRALIVADPNLRGELKRRGFLTRDPRVKERKKAGLKKARKRPQFSKR